MKGRGLNIGGMVSMTENTSVIDDVISVGAEIHCLRAEVERLARENEVLLSEINYLKRAAEYFYNESLDAFVRCC